jgi:hypothetical protein
VGRQPTDPATGGLPNPSSPTSVLVLWVDEIQILRDPLNMLARLLGDVSAPLESDGRIAFNVIGPATSTSFRFLLRRLSDTGDIADSPTVASKIQFYSSRATRWYKFFSEDELCTFEDLQGIEGDERSCPRDPRPVLDPGTTASQADRDRLVVTISNDHTVLETLVDELVRRGVRVEADDGEEPDHIAIIGEWDTHYGRALSRTLRTILCERGGTLESECLGLSSSDLRDRTDTVEEFHYLRGIDGLVPGAENATNDRNSGADASGAINLRRMELPEGPSQLDYVRRMAEVISARDREIRRTKKASIAAVGVAGSDLYDKQLILQALRSQLPDAVFFTTDLDARLLHPSQYDWSRNLIVGSSFGLTLRRELQGTIPPFRNVYQTSTFLATQLALRPLEVVLDPDEEASVDAATAGTTESRETRVITDAGIGWYLGAPRIFEVARSGGYDLSPAPLDPMGDLLHPEAADNRPRILTNAWAFVLLAIAPLALVPFSSSARRWLFFWLRNPDEEEPVPVKIQLVWLLPFVILLVLIVLTAPGPAKSISPVVVNSILIGLAVVIVALLGARASRRRLLASRTIAKRSRNVILSVQAMLLVVLALLLLAIFFDARSPTGEPLALLQGISVWPTEIIRLFAVMMSLFFMVNAAFDLRYSNRNIEQRYGLPTVDGGTRPSAVRAGDPGDDRTGWISRLWLWVTHHVTHVAETDWQRRDPTPSWARSKGCRTFSHSGEDDSDPTEITLRAPTIGVEDLWIDYQRRGSPRRRAIRITLWLIAYLVFFSVIFGVFGRPPSPARGEFARWIDSWLTFASALGLVVSALFVLDSNNLTGKITKCFEHYLTFWPKGALDMARQQRGIEDIEASEWLEINFIAERTAVVGNFVVHPFLILTVLLLARNSFFDLWTWPFSLVLVFVVLSIFIIASGLVLRRSAESARSRSLRNLTNLLSRLEASKDDADRRRIPLVRMVMDDIRAIRTGAFSAWGDNPVLRAILLPFGGTGIMVLFEVLGNAGL